MTFLLSYNKTLVLIKINIAVYQGSSTYVDWKQNDQQNLKKKMRMKKKGLLQTHKTTET